MPWTDYEGLLGSIFGLEVLGGLHFRLIGSSIEALVYMRDGSFTGRRKNDFTSIYNIES
jgi:hypothetical protein